VIISSQIKSRLAKTAASVIVLAVLILTLWLPDPKSARIEIRLNPIREALESKFPGSKVTIIPEIMEEKVY